MRILRDKIDKFIRKYYYNQILIGIIALFGISISLLLVFIFIEHFSWLSSTGRAFLFWIMLISAIGISILLIIIPTLKLFKLGKYISYPDAARIIGKHFPEVRDKLLNYLQLEEMEQLSSDNKDFIVHSINQKIDALKPLNFSQAVDFKTTKKYLLYALPVIVIFLLIFIIKPTIIKSSTERIINYNKEYVKPQDFYINLASDDLQAVQNSDYSILFNISGSRYPENLKLFFGNNSGNFENTYMTKVNDSLYQFTLKRLQKNISFFAVGENVSSQTYTLQVLPKPSLLNFEISLNYPKYTNIPEQTIENTGTFNVIYGTKAKWKLFTRDTEGIIVLKNNVQDTLSVSSANVFSFDSRFVSDTDIKIIFFNKYIHNEDTLKFNIRVNNDLAPEIKVTELRDSVFFNNLYFSGLISDDFGFSSLKFYYRIFQGDNPYGNFWNLTVPFNKGVVLQNFYWSVNGDELGLFPGDAVEYYFEVCDNDAEKGYKCTSSSRNIYNKLTAFEMDKLSDANRESFKSNIDNSLEDIKEIKKEIEDFLLNLKEKENLTFQDKEKLESLLQKQQEIKDAFEKEVDNMNIDKMNQNEYNEFNENILEKQAKLEELYNKILDEEMRKLIAELEKMLENFNKDDLDQQLRDLKMSTEEMEKQLDQTIELFKRLEFEQEFNKAIAKLDTLANRLDKLSENTENKDNNSFDELSAEQDNINQEFDEIKEQLDKLDKLNNKLEEKHKIDFQDKMQENITSDLNKSKDKLDNKDKNASKDQKSGAKKMKDLSESLQMQFDADFGQQQAEDMENIRRMLQNIIHLSFKEESYIDDLKIIRRADPKYVQIILRQNEVNQQIKLVEDSLSNLARRNFQISAIIFEELSKLKKYSSTATENLSDRNVRQAMTNLQHSMTSLNQLALLLAESLDNTEDDDSGMCSSSCPNGKKKKSGKGSKPDISTMKQLQEQLNQQMQDMMKQQKDQQGKPMPGAGKPGSELYAKMAAQQEAIRRELEKLQQELRSQGQNMDGSLQEAINAMEKTETDLINKRLTEAMLKRQEEIVTRLLASEKASREREKDEKRESKSGKFYNRQSPEEIFFNKDNEDGMTDKLKTIPPNLNNYYKQKVDQYRFGLNNKE
ncbi:DUF4175 family protein [Bacteroidales bacterium OttesenSCG-928-K03]|nr:DUF4175 family protein [Bacteroidales bacterium OttesenSCG-928-L14]MDL2241098.1 DUF4175 family protein [Bacteroidales bacterium OttesenSCG-928-K22]MDL2242861.1 DUF4175 family protein [Bacteroidales bacterium OttesenSCG-928-K03]